MTCHLSAFLSFFLDLLRLLLPIFTPYYMLNKSWSNKRARNHTAWGTLTWLAYLFYAQLDAAGFRIQIANSTTHTKLLLQLEARPATYPSTLFTKIRMVKGGNVRRKWAKGSQIGWKDYLSACFWKYEVMKQWVLAWSDLKRSTWLTELLGRFCQDLCFFHSRNTKSQERRSLDTQLGNLTLI